MPHATHSASRPPIHIVWLKRDLRLSDHEPLHAALQNGPTLLLYLFEPELLNDAHYSERHWRFVWQSLQHLNAQLAPFGHQILVVQGSAKHVFDTLAQHVEIQGIYSHEEIGLALTYQRDQQLKAWCEGKAIPWFEFPSGAVIRGATNRDKWDKQWQKTMRSPIKPIELSAVALLSIGAPTLGLNSPDSAAWHTKQAGMQTGGSDKAWQTLNDFFDRRGNAYYYSLSSPTAARHACSRMSPYLAWGCISLREMYQALLAHWGQRGFRRSAIALSSRLHWHCHFIQKFESEHEIEHRCVNRGYEHLLSEHTRSAPPAEPDIHMQRLTAWQNGNTGIPLVDACMRCLHHTGYLNFRMRAMLVSVLTHHLALDWRLGVKHLAALFLDFEPGIHYAQFQMQAGVIGINTIRIYNPTKQAQEHDPDGVFIHRWVPELADVPPPLLFEPWTMTPMEVALYDLPHDSHYLDPIIDLDAAARSARERLWGWKKHPVVQQEAKRILKRHVLKK